MRRSWIALITSALIVASTALVSTSAHAVTPDSTFSVSGEPGDYIAGGLNETFTAATTPMSLSGTAANLHFGFVKLPEFWYVDLGAPPGSRLAPGTYPNATRMGTGLWPSESVYGDGRGCNQSWGSFTINRLFTDAHDNVALLDADITQHCESPTAPALHAHVSVNQLAASNPPTAVDDSYATPAATPLVVAGPGVLGNDADPDSGDHVARAAVKAAPQHGTVTMSTSGGFTYTPAAGFNGFDTFTYTAVDTHGNASAPATVRLKVGYPPHDLFSYESAAGDYIGGGQSQRYTDAESTFHATGTMNGVQLDVAGNTDWWTIDLAAPKGTTLAPGHYTGATRFPFQAATAPGLSMYGDGRGCNGSYGDFTINAISFDPSGAPTMIDADFTQHCEQPTAPALTGSIRYQIPAQFPLTAADGYTTPEGTALRVAAPGVLSNDHSPDARNALHAELGQGPAHGSVTLNADGSFAYTPTPGFTGNDTFTYVAVDPFGTPSTATPVHLTVSGPAQLALLVLRVGHSPVVAFGPTTGGALTIDGTGHEPSVTGIANFVDADHATGTIAFAVHPPDASGSRGLVAVLDPHAELAEFFTPAIITSTGPHAATGLAVDLAHGALLGFGVSQG